MGTPISSSDNVSIPQNLLLEQSFEHMIAMSLDECAAKVQALGYSSGLINSGSKVSITTSNQGFAAVVKRPNKSATVWGIIRTETAKDDTLRVRIKVGVEASILATSPIVVLLFAVMVISKSNNERFMALGVCCLMLLWMFYIVQSQKTKLIRDIRNALNINIP